MCLIVQPWGLDNLHLISIAFCMSLSYYYNFLIGLCISSLSLLLSILRVCNPLKCNPLKWSIYIYLLGLASFSKLLHSDLVTASTLWLSLCVQRCEISWYFQDRPCSFVLSWLLKLFSSLLLFFLCISKLRLELSDDMIRHLLYMQLGIRLLWFLPIRPSMYHLQHIQHGKYKTRV